MTSESPALVLPPSIILPPHMQPRVEAQAAPDENASDADKADALPVPTGFRMLCIVPKVEQKFENSEIIKADIVARNEELTTNVLFVLRMGPDAYKDEKRFPTGPWCKEGDFILVRTYAGTRFTIFGKEFRLIADDEVAAVVADPRGIARA